MMAPSVGQLMFIFNQFTNKYLLTPIKIKLYLMGQVFSLILAVRKKILVWYNAAMTEKSTQLLKIFPNIVINTNCFLLSSATN